MRYCFLFAITTCSLNVSAQSSQEDSLNYVRALQNAKKTYWQYISPSTGLYNGAEYIDYAYSIKEGHPYFGTADFKAGSVLYDGILYENVAIQYDIIKEKIVIDDPFKVYKLELTNERVKDFTVDGHKFTRLIKNDSDRSVINTGYYEILYDLGTTVYKKQQKQLQEETSLTEGLKRYVVESTSYFIKKENKFYTVSSKKSLLAIFKDRKNELQQFMRKNKLSYKKARQNTITKVAGYYDQLTLQHSTGQ